MHRAGSAASARDNPNAGARDTRPLRRDKPKPSPDQDPSWPNSFRNSSGSFPNRLADSRLLLGFSAHGAHHVVQARRFGVEYLQAETRDAVIAAALVVG